MRDKSRVYVYRDELEQLRKSNAATCTYYIDGNDSIYVPQLNTKFIDKTACQEWPNIHGEVLMMTPGEIARSELTRFFPDTNFRARKSDFKLLDISPPLYFLGRPYHGPLYYIDLRGAYASIYRWLTLDIAWPRGQGEMPLAGVAARLWNHKTARNSVIGITRSHEIMGVKGPKAFWVHYHNNYFNPHLWHTVQQVLHDIAHVALGYGAIYISTDCYMFPHRTGFYKMADLLQDVYQFETHQFLGDGHIWGWGSYSLPGRTKKLVRETNQKIIKVQGKGDTLKWLKKYISK